MPHLRPCHLQPQRGDTPLSLRSCSASLEQAGVSSACIISAACRGRTGAPTRCPSEACLLHPGLDLLRQVGLAPADGCWTARKQGRVHVVSKGAVAAAGSGGGKE